MNRGVLAIALIVLAGVTAYAHVTSAFFCGFDDFNESNRALFEDTHSPERIFTTTHFDSPKYRPLNRLLTWVCVRLGGGTALPFRLRNLFFHLTASILVYLLAQTLTGDWLVALFAGLMFCLEPMVNQNVSAAVFTNTVAYSFVLGSLLLFIRSLREDRPLWILSSMGLALTGLFLYESTIVVFGLMVAFLALWKLRGGKVNRRWFAVSTLGAAFVLLIFGIVRHLVVHLSSGITPPGVMIRNLLVYCAALLIPVDPVLTSVLFGTSLPPNINLRQNLGLAAVAGCAVMVLALLGLVRRTAVRKWIARLDWALILFLVFGIFAPLLPVLVFAPHPSETYLYLPCAFYCILLSVFLRNLGGNFTCAAAVAVLLISFSCGTVLRNERVTACGSVARRILAQLPTSTWKTGTWHIRLFDSPGEEPSPKYGVYAYEGLATIDPAEAGNRSAESALRNVSGNEGVAADVMPFGSANECPVTEPCFQISRDGTVRATR